MSGTIRSARTIENVQRVCDTHLAGCYQLEVIDLIEHPEVAQQEEILAVPMLVRTSPLPMKRTLGDLSPAAEPWTALELDLVHSS